MTKSRAPDLREKKIHWWRLAVANLVLLVRVQVVPNHSGERERDLVEERERERATERKR